MMIEIILCGCHDDVVDMRIEMMKWLKFPLIHEYYININSNTKRHVSINTNINWNVNTNRNINTNINTRINITRNRKKK